MKTTLGKVKCLLKNGDLTSKTSSEKSYVPSMFHEFNGTIFKQFTKPNSTTNKNLPVFQTELENSKKKLGKKPLYSMND